LVEFFMIEPENKAVRFWLFFIVSASCLAKVCPRSLARVLVCCSS